MRLIFRSARQINSEHVPEGAERDVTDLALARMLIGNGLAEKVIEQPKEEAGAKEESKKSKK